MKKTDVIFLLQQLDSNNIGVWIDGGWGVDALIGKQTRDHDDLDIVVQKKDLAKLRQMLFNKGFENIPQDDTRDWNFVVGNNGLLIDIHVIEIDKNGDGVYGPRENNQQYPAPSLISKGMIGEMKVKCISPEYQIQSHVGYELKDKDFHDVQLLCEKFNVELPEEYKQ